MPIPIGGILRELRQQMREKQDAYWLRKLSHLDGTRVHLAVMTELTDLILLGTKTIESRFS